MMAPPIGQLPGFNQNFNDPNFRPPAPFVPQQQAPPNWEHRYVYITFNITIANIGIF